ncbi:hypothetical protein DF186_24340, partial [Enterococcus hirae]
GLLGRSRLDRVGEVPHDLAQRRGLVEEQVQQLVAARRHGAPDGAGGADREVVREPGHLGEDVGAPLLLAGQPQPDDPV